MIEWAHHENTIFHMETHYYGEEDSYCFDLEDECYQYLKLDPNYDDVENNACFAGDEEYAPCKQCVGEGQSDCISCPTGFVVEVVKEVKIYIFLY